MANIITATENFIEVSLDGIEDFDSRTDLTGLGLAKNAPDGLRVRKVIFYPSAIGDEVVVRDGQNGPGFFRAEVIDTWDALKDEYREDGKIDRGKVMSPYIHAIDCTIGVQNQAYVVFEL